MSSQSGSRKQYRFGEFLLDRASRELHRGKELLTLSPKVFDCIVYLIEHHDRAVGHDELIAAVWGAVNVAEVQLRHLIRKVRYTVDANASGEGSIRTIPRFGYRWVAALTNDSAAVAESSQPAHAGAVSEAQRKPAPWAAISVSSFVLLALILLVAKSGYFGMGEANKLAPGATNAVAVLPVESDDLGENEAWMRLGLMDLVATHLRNAGVAVIPSSDIVLLEHSDLHGATLVAKIRQVAGASNVIESRVRHDDSGWVLNVQLEGRDNASSKRIEVRAQDAIGATQKASDELLTLLGRHPQIDGALKDSLGVAELQQRMDAAWLAGNMDLAKRIWESAPATVKALPEIQVLHAKIDLVGGDAVTVELRLQKMLDGLSPEADPQLRAAVLNELGAAERQTENLDLARQRFDQSVRLLDNLNQPLLLGHAYVGRAAIGSLQGRYDDARADFSHARIAFELAGDAVAVARAEANEGVLEAMQAHPSQAVSLLSHAAQNLDRFGDRSWLVNTLANLVSAQLDLLRAADAFATSQRMKPELPEMGSSMYARVARIEQVPALLNSGHLREGQSLIEELRGLESVRQDRGTLGAIDGYEARLALDSGRWQVAFDSADASVARLTDREDEDARETAWLIKIRALRALRRDQDAALEVQKLSTWSHERPTPRRILRAELAEAEQAWAEHRPQPGYELYEIALHMAHERGVPSDVAEVVVSYGNALLSAGELSRAATVVGQVSPWAEYDFDCALLQARLYQKLRRDELWHAALANARTLALERAIPADVAETPAASASSVAVMH